jgi:hypothetical protein
MRFRRRQRIPKPAQRHCARCRELFVYFQITKARMYCAPCHELERRDHNAFHNMQVSAERAAARVAA